MSNFTKASGMFVKPVDFNKSSGRISANAAGAADNEKIAKVAARMDRVSEKLLRNKVAPTPEAMARLWDKITLNEVRWSSGNAQRA